MKSLSNVLNKIRALGSALMLLSLLSNVAQADVRVRLTWDPNTEPDLAGYRLYCGSTSASYDTVLQVGLTNVFEVTSLSPGKTYYFAVTAYNTLGLESGPSNEIEYRAPAANTAPTAIAATINLSEDTSAPIKLQATDAEGDALTWTIVQGPAHGAISGTAPNLTYTPAPNFYGNDALSFKVSDGALSSQVAVVSIVVAPVNDAPTALPLTVQTTAGEPTPVTLRGQDIDSSTLTYSIVSGPAHGTLTGSGAQRIYTASKTYSGSDQFVYAVSDGQLSATATVSIQVVRNIKPPVATPDRMIVLQGSTVTRLVDGQASVTANDSTFQGDSITARLATPPMFGELTLQPSGAFAYRHFGGQEAQDSFTYTVRGEGGESQEVAVTIHVMRIVNVRNEGADTLLDFTVLEGLAYHAEYQDLSRGNVGKWRPIASFTADATGVATVTDTSFTQIGTRLYRVRCVGAHGELISPEWGSQRVEFSSWGTLPTSTFYGPVVRHARVTSVNADSITVEGPAWSANELARGYGVATHAVRVLNSSKSAAGTTFVIVSNTNSALQLDPEGSDLRASLAAGDIVEVSVLQTAASLFGNAEASGLNRGDVIKVLAADGSLAWLLAYVPDNTGKLRYFMDIGKGFYGGFDGTTVGFHPSERLSYVPEGKKQVRFTISGRVPTP